MNYMNETTKPNEGEKRVQISSALPPCNTEATKPADIYSLGDIVDEQLLEALMPEAERFLRLNANEIREEGESPSSFSSGL